MICAYDQLEPKRKSVNHSITKGPSKTESCTGVRLRTESTSQREKVLQRRVQEHEEMQHGPRTHANWETTFKSMQPNEQLFREKEKQSLRPTRMRTHPWPICFPFGRTSTFRMHSGNMFKRTIRTSRMPSVHSSSCPLANSCSSTQLRFLPYAVESLQSQKAS